MGHPSHPPVPSSVRAGMRALVVMLVFVVGPGCGYRAVEARSGREAFHIVFYRSGAVRNEVRREVELGVREALMKDGEVLSGEGYPAVEYEVIDTLDEPTAIRAASGAPTAGGVRVRVRGRAWIRRVKDGPAERETGDLAGENVVAAASDHLLGASAELRGAELGAARRLGNELGRSVLGVPVVPLE